MFIIVARFMMFKMYEYTLNCDHAIIWFPRNIKVTEYVKIKSNGKNFNSSFYFKIEDNYAS